MNHIKALVFDLYGTLYDVYSVRTACDAAFPGRGDEVSRQWRQKQLEYTWMRSLMNQYKDFESATHEALRHTCGMLHLPLDRAVEDRLCDAYLALDPYPAVPQALRDLRAAGLRTAILSNGSPHSIRAVVANSGLTDAFDELVSVDKLRMFKPHPQVYALAMEALGLARHEILFVSCNSWDATGAKHFGYTVCWINRFDGVFDELDVLPDIVVREVDELLAHFAPSIAQAAVG